MEKIRLCEYGVFKFAESYPYLRNLIYFDHTYTNI